jgi:hypothetical protein
MRRSSNGIPGNPYQTEVDRFSLEKVNDIHPFLSITHEPHKNLSCLRSVSESLTSRESSRSPLALAVPGGIPILSHLSLNLLCPPIHFSARKVNANQDMKSNLRICQGKMTVAGPLRLRRPTPLRENPPLAEVLMKSRK